MLYNPRHDICNNISNTVGFSCHQKEQRSNYLVNQLKQNEGLVQTPAPGKTNSQSCVHRFHSHVMNEGCEQFSVSYHRRGKKSIFKKGVQAIPSQNKQISLEFHRNRFIYLSRFRRQTSTLYFYFLRYCRRTLTILSNTCTTLPIKNTIDMHVYYHQILCRNFQTHFKSIHFNSKINTLKL